MNIEQLEELRELAKTHPTTAIKTAYGEGMLAGINQTKAYQAQEAEAVAEVRCRNGEVFGYIASRVLRDMLPLGTKLYTHPPFSQAQEGEAVGKLICDPMGLPALHIPLVDWYVDLGTLEIDTLFYTHPPASQARIAELQATNKKLLDALKASNIILISEGIYSNQVAINQQVIEYAQANHQN